MVKLFSKINTQVVLLSVAFFILILIIPACSATSIQMFSIDSKTYTAGEAISVSGEILDGNASGLVKITILSSNDFTEISNKTINASSAIFSTTISAPDTAGNYSIKATETENESSSPYLNFTVLGIDDPKTIKIQLTEGQILTVNLSSSHDIQGPLNRSKTGGNITFEDKKYYFLVSNDNTAYMDDDNNMNLSSDSYGKNTIANLVEGSKVNLNTTTYTLIHIHNETEIVLARPVDTAFSGGESVNVTLLALNATNYPINSNILLDYVKEDSTPISNSTITTGNNGIATIKIIVEANSGVYHLIAGDIGHISLKVNTVDMLGDILSEENKPKHTFATGDILVPVLYLKNRSSGVPIENAAVTAKITCASNASNTHTLTLTYDSNISAYSYSYTVPTNATIDTYNVEYIAVVGSQTQKAYTSYYIKDYDLFLKAISKNNEDSDGFAPGEESFLIIAGTDLSTGNALNIKNMTGLEIARFKVNITDISGQDVTANWSLMNLTTFITRNNVPDEVHNEIKRIFSENVTIINFTAPSDNGIYDILVQVKLSDWVKVKTSISIQDLFIHGEPVNKNGWFNPKVAPEGTARLMIMAFNPKTGEVLNSDDINDAGLVEVWSASTNDIVTEYMLNASLDTINIPFMSDIKVLKFKVNDSQLGFHHVKFWINATVEGTYKTVIGDGWFDEKLYTIYAKPSMNNESGMYKVFGSDDTISLDVKVKDVSGNNVFGATIAIDSVRHGMTGEMVPLDDSLESYTTDTSGEVTINFTATNSLKSGFYNVRIKMTTQDGVTDYGNGWFDVSNFIFYAYSSSWNAGLNQPINFTLNAFSSSFDNKNISVNLTKIISMGSWEMMAPPIVYNDTIVYCGYINGTGYYDYTAGLSEGGNFEFVFEAFDGNLTEVGRAWVHVTPFVAWVETDDWRHDFSVSDFMNFTIVASKDREDKESGGTPQNITNVTIEKVMQEGMWMTTYRNTSQMDAITTTEDVDGSMNKINISINTTGWSEGFYSMMLKVTDNESNEIYLEFWFKLELASVTVPDMMWVEINAGNYHTNAASFNVTTDITTKKDKFAGNNMGNVSAGKVGGIILNDNHNDAITMIKTNDMDSVVDIWNHSEVPYFAMVVVDTVNKTVYIEYENQSEGGKHYYNLSNPATTQVFNASVGDNFTDYTGRTWNITEITNDGTVKLEGANCLKNGLIMSPDVMSQSKSGKFLMGMLHDCDWQQIDLDGDGEYWNDEYNILMVDNATSGQYEAIYISNTSNFSTGTYIDATAGTAVQFGGKPTYLVSKKYKSGMYELRLTTYSEGWPGMHIGTYSNGSVVKIPFLVLNPSGSALSEKNVTIDFLMDEGRDKQYLTGVNGTTDENGLVIISINTSATSIQTGEWMIHYNVSMGGGEYAVADEEMFWEMTRFELRNFEVSGALGIPGSIDLIELRDSDTTDYIPGNNMLLSYGDEVEFKSGIGLWPCYDSIYILEYPFDKWYYNSTTGYFNYSTDWGHTLHHGSDYYINSSSTRIAMDYNVTSINNTGDQITLSLGSAHTFYDDMWIFNVTNIEGTSHVTISMSYVGWPWTLSDGDSWSQPQSETLANGSSWWMAGLDFKVVTINESNGTVILQLNRPVLVASVDAMNQLIDNDENNGELDNMRGSVNKVNFNGNEYLVYGYEDKDNTSEDLVEWAWVETMDRVLVENISSGTSKSYRIGENITELDNYYAASVSEWGGKLVLLNSSVTQIFPIPQWTSDAPIYYAGTFSDADVGVDIPLLGRGFEPCIDFENISTDKRYSILLYDRCSNGENFPSEGLYDDDPDLTNIMKWDYNEIAYDMYGLERGYSDSLSWNADITCDPGVIIPWKNMSEHTVWQVGTGEIDRGESISIPTFMINNTAKTAIAKTFAAYDDFNKSDNITILVTAKDFDGAYISGNATLVQLKMMFGGFFSVDEGFNFIADLPKTWDMTSAGVNATMVDGEGLLKMTPDQIPDDLKSGGSHDFLFGEFTAIITVIDDSSRTETLKINFFMVDRSMESQLMDDEEGGLDKPGEPGESGGGY